MHIFYFFDKNKHQAHNLDNAHHFSVAINKISWPN